MEVKTYNISVKQGRRIIIIKTTGSSEDAAKNKVIQAENCPPSAIIKAVEIRKPKYNYINVIQQYYGYGWEDVSEYEANSKGVSNEPSGQMRTLKKSGVKVPITLLAADLKEYKFTGYPTRVIFRRELNK